LIARQNFTPFQDVKNRFNKDGTCPTCLALGGWLCELCKKDNAARDRANATRLKLVCESIKANEVARVCAAFELESDEFLTREQKAVAIISRRPVAASRRENF
jgi:hypothetical protein